MKNQLHLCVGKLSAKDQELIAAEKAARPEATVTTKTLQVENAAEILEAVFQADSICFWNHHNH